MKMINRYSSSLFDRYFALQLSLFQFATTPGAVTGAGGAGGGGEGGGGGAPGGAGGAPGAAGTGTGGAPPSINWETAPQQFRDGYNKLKADFEKLSTDYKPWQEFATTNKLTAEALPGIHGTYQQVYEQINGIAEELGIADEEISEAVEKHGIIKVLDHLRSEYAEGQGGAGGGEDNRDLSEIIEERINQALSPIQERENQRLTDAGNQRFEQIVNQELVKIFKAEGVEPGAIPQPESFMLMNGASELLKYDEAALVALKNGQGQAQVQKAIQQMKTFLDQYYLSRSGRERAAVGGQGNRGAGAGAGAGAGNGGGRKPTLDEMIEEPTLINKKYQVGT